MPWSEFMPLGGGKDIKSTKGVSPLALKKSTAGKAVLSSLSGDSYQKKLSGKNLYNVTDVKTYDATTCKVDASDFVTLEYDNTNGTSTYFANYFTHLMANITPSTSYMAIVEVIENTSNKLNLTVSSHTSSNDSQFATTWSHGTSVGTYSKVLTTMDAFDGCVCGLRSYVAFPAGTSGKMTFRISILTDTNTVLDNFVYEPYCGGMASPNPDYPQEIESVGDSGWFDGKLVQGSFDVGVETASTTRLRSGYIPVKVGDVIKITVKNALAFGLFIYDENKECVYSGSMNVSDYTYTVTTGSYMRFSIRYDDNTTITPNDDISVSVTINGQYATHIKTVGKNLLKNTAVTTEKNGVTFTVNEDGSVTVNGTASATTVFILNDSLTLSDGTYVLNGCPSGGGSATNYKLDILKDNVWVAVDTGENIVRMFDTANDQILTIRIVVYSGATVSDLTFYPMIRKADVTDATYTPYTESTITIPLTEPLRAIGEVKDEICIQDGKYGVMRRVGSVVLDGSEDEAWQLNYQYADFNVFYIEDTSFALGWQKSVCSHFTNVKASYAEATGAEGYYSDHNTVQRKYFCTSKEFTSAALFKTWLASNPVTVDYELATPVFEPFDDQTAFNGLTSADGVTYVSIEGLSDNLSPEMNVYYPGSEEGNGVMSLVGAGGSEANPGSEYLRYDADNGNIQVLDADGNWQDYIACETLPVPTSEVLYLNGTEYITWSENSVYASTYSFTDNITKYADRMVLTALGSNGTTSGGVSGQYTFDNKFNYLHVMNSAGTVNTLDCSSVTGTYYILINNSGWDNCFRLGVSPYTYNFNGGSGTSVSLALMNLSLAVNGSVTITKIWIDNKAS